jgi:hypothetical protein
MFSVDGHLPEIWMIVEVSKSDAAGVPTKSSIVTCFQQSLVYHRHRGWPTRRVLPEKAPVDAAPVVTAVKDAAVAPSATPLTTPPTTTLFTVAALVAAAPGEQSADDTCHT